MTGEASRGVEAVKWLAFALMVLDHVTIWVTDERPAWAYLLGRLVFPLFAMSLAYGLSKGGELAFQSASRRLLMWAVIAQVPFAYLVPGFVLNVLFTFWAAVFLYSVAVWRRWSFATAALVLLAVLGVHAVEFGPVGVLFVVAAIGHARAEGVARRYWVGAFWITLTLLHAVNGVPAAMLAPLVFWAVVKWAEAPRIKHAFYWLYPAQFAAVAALRAVL